MLLFSTAYVCPICFCDSVGRATYGLQKHCYCSAAKRFFCTATCDVLVYACMVVCVVLMKATILEEMPPFPERESSILAKLKKKRPDKVANNTIEPRASNVPGAADNGAVQSPKPTAGVRLFSSFIFC